MAENDNNDRPRSNGSKGTPERNFTTNNVRSTNENYTNDKQSIRKSNDSKPTKTPTKKGK